MKRFRYVITLLGTILIFNAMPLETADPIDKIPAGNTIGGKIATCAESFVGRPYDPDPLGEYVRRNVIVADERVDCMYLTFRCAELALSNTPQEAVEKALSMRFITHGILKAGKVVNYDERFQYGTDMIESGKWGVEVTENLGNLSNLPGTRGRKTIRIQGKTEAQKNIPKLKNGDLLYFIKDPDRRVVDEMVGHLGFVKKDGEKTFLVHASGRKNGTGLVKKVSLMEYFENMHFVGIRVTRFE